MSLTKLANRNEHIDPFHVMELVKYAARLEAEGKSVIHLSIGEPDFTAPEPIVRALHTAADEGHMKYTDAVGIAPLREAIARDYQDTWHVDVDPDCILVTAGASAALTLACAALVNPGDGVLVADPSYPCNRHFVAAFDGVPQLVPTSTASRFQLSLDNVKANWQPHTRGALISSPANPTGTSIPTAEMGRILAEIRQRNGFSIVDEIYLGLSYQDDVTTALTHGNDMVITNSFSKYFNMTGWRLGWLVVPAEWRGAFEKLAQNLLICASSLSQRAALACFEPESRAIFDERKAVFKERRDYLVPALESIGVKVPTAPDGAFYIYADISAFSEDSSRFAYDLLDNTGVALVPGKDFGIQDAEKFVRISYANSMENLREAVDRIDGFVNKRAS